MRLQKVPLVAVEIFEDRDDAIGFVSRCLQKFDIVGPHLTVVAPEIIGVEKQENTPASLIADGVRLLGHSGLSEKETGAVGVWRPDNQPARSGRGVSSMRRKPRAFVKKARASS